jgi:tetratricopeptide (TPR) repeat protein
LEGSVANYPGIPAWRAGLAGAYCRIGRLGEATAIIDDAARDRFAHVPHDPVRMSALVLYADAAAHTASVEAAGYLYELLEPWADQVVYTDALGYGHTRLYLGELAHTIGRHDLALEHLEFACRFHEEHGILLWAAESHVWLARALTGRGDTAAAAREHCERALELAREHGYGEIEKRAGALISAEVSAEN